mmetsp:Transcript_68697/g.129630  ORF Transcript_68697/g.129630 Transcript_68697/m.129630 type:complete len:333 (+) Transcript_68697:101-1099(+)
MVKLVNRKKAVPVNLCMSEACSHKIDHLIEIGYVFGSALFIYGTLLSFPSIKWIPEKEWGITQEEVANLVNDIGSVIFFVLALYDVTDKYIKRRAGEEHVTRKELIEQFLYVVGSFLFAVGTNCYDDNVLGWFKRVAPGTFSEIDFDLWGAILFMTGSCMFGMAVYVDALDMKHTRLSCHNHALMISILNEIGSFMFLCGTVPYLPGFDPAADFGYAFARWNYLIGSCLFTYSAFLGMLRSVAIEMRGKLGPQPDAKERQCKQIVEMLTSHGIWLQPGAKQELDTILNIPEDDMTEPYILKTLWTGCTTKINPDAKANPLVPKHEYRFYTSS